MTPVDRSAKLSLSGPHYEDKLLAALDHHIPDHQMTAIRVLGELCSARAIPAFERLLAQGADIYVRRGIAGALARIDSPESVALLHRLALAPALTVAGLARQLLAEREARTQ